jgi:ABC-type transport system substrate-binding protein
VSHHPHSLQPSLPRRGWHVLVILVVGSLLLTTVSCGLTESGEEPTAAAVPVQGEDGEGEGTTGGPREVRPLSRSEDPVTLDLSLETDPSSLDPALVSDRASLDCTANLFVGLTRYDPDTSAVLPYLATSWEVSEDGLTYTFYLRGDVQWIRYDQGTGSIALQRTVNAHDVEYSVKRAIDPTTGSQYAYVLYGIQNAALVHSGGCGGQSTGRHDHPVLPVESGQLFPCHHCHVGHQASATGAGKGAPRRLDRTRLYLDERPVHDDRPGG